MVGGYQIINLKNCINPSEGLFASKKLIGTKKPIILQCNGLNHIYSFSNWKSIFYGDIDGNGKMGYIYEGKFMDGEDEISIEIDISDVPEEGPGFLYNTIINISGGSE